VHVDVADRAPLAGQNSSGRDSGLSQALDSRTPRARYVRLVERWASPYLAAQAAYLRHLGTAATAEVFEVPGVYAVRTGIASNTENGVLSSGQTRLSEQQVSAVARWLDSSRVPASWLCAEGGQKESAYALLAAGWRPDNDSWEMRAEIARLSLDRLAPPAGVAIVTVSSAPELDAWLDVGGACGWFDTAEERQAWRKLHLALDRGRSAASRLCVAFRGDRPVGMAASFDADAIVLLSAVAVVADERRRGIGRSLALARLRDAREHGCALAVLAPSPDGVKLYGSLGFEAHRQPQNRWFFLPVPSAPADEAH
jgi:GNAT superfamily N-acetyltransferase